MPNDSTTGDIVWRRLDPKTVELFNRIRSRHDVTIDPNDPTTQVQDTKASPREVETIKALMSGKSRPQGEALPNPPYADEAGYKQRRFWNNQIKDFFKNQDSESDYDPVLAIQNMIDSGALRYDEDGLSISTNLKLSPEQNQVLVRLADEWAANTGLWRRGEGGGESFDPGNYRPYIGGQ